MPERRHFWDIICYQSKCHKSGFLKSLNHSAVLEWLFVKPISAASTWLSFDDEKIGKSERLRNGFGRCLPVFLHHRLVWVGKPEDCLMLFGFSSLYLSCNVSGCLIYIYSQTLWVLCEWEREGGKEGPTSREIQAGLWALVWILAFSVKGAALQNSNS